MAPNEHLQWQKEAITAAAARINKVETGPKTRADSVVDKDTRETDKCVPRAIFFHRNTFAHTHTHWVYRRRSRVCTGPGPESRLGRGTGRAE